MKFTLYHSLHKMFHSSEKLMFEWRSLAMDNVILVCGTQSMAMLSPKPLYEAVSILFI